ncbi:60S ribosomal protein L23a-like [Phyllostomus discolor]|uniref:60S ribosomal protein L23a-like n=1 Tax=Phyllostomus discolor TaxID=89673 RepID=A0A7E6DHG0_9CHIR|nr:60S ribosomal protein L23a-like [Phyllostomus discolor]
MTLKVKEEAPAPPKAEAKAKTLKAKKAVLKGAHSHKERRSASGAKDTPALKVICAEDRRQLVFVVDVKANKPWVRRAVKKLYDIDAAKVNIQIRPDGKKKAAVQLAPNYELWMLPTKLGASKLSIAG